MSTLNLYFAELPSFDDLKELALTNPEAFDAFRRYHCENYINSLAEDRQHRMQCVQNRIDNEIDRSPNPVSAIIKLSSMMHDSFEKMAKGFNGKIDPATFADSSGNVVPLFRPNA